MSRKRKQRRSATRAERLRDGGPDPSGNYGVNPYTARGHVIEAAPKELRANGHSQFPKRVASQRMLDRYRVHGHITVPEWRAGNAMWELWNSAELEAKVTAGYEPVIVSSSPNMDGRIAKKVDSAIAFVELMRLVPYHAQGVVRAVVVLDWSAADWARLRGLGRSDSERHGLARLRQGLSALAGFLGY